MKMEKIISNKLNGKIINRESDVSAITSRFYINYSSENILSGGKF